MKAYIIPRGSIVVIGHTAYEITTGKFWKCSTKGLKEYPYLEVDHNSWYQAWGAWEDFKELRRKGKIVYGV
jgi:hypothetical protein